MPKRKTLRHLKCRILFIHGYAPESNWAVFFPLRGSVYRFVTSFIFRSRKMVVYVKVDCKAYTLDVWFDYKKPAILVCCRPTVHWHCRVWECMCASVYMYATWKHCRHLNDNVDVANMAKRCWKPFFLPENKFKWHPWRWCAELCAIYVLNLVLFCEPDCLQIRRQIGITMHIAHTLTFKSHYTFQQNRPFYY